MIIEHSRVTQKIEAFESVRNAEILKNKNRENYPELTWYSAGDPRIVSTSSTEKDLFIFHYNEFFIRVDMLNEEHRYLFKNEIKKKI